jgi:hypothetical protein
MAKQIVWFSIAPPKTQKESYENIYQINLK